jgi:hypothetical protein
MCNDVIPTLLAILVGVETIALIGIVFVLRKATVILPW